MWKRAGELRRLGTINFFGELFKRRLLTEMILHECIRKLMDVGPGGGQVEPLLVPCRPQNKLNHIDNCIRCCGRKWPLNCFMQTPTDEDLEALCKLLTNAGRLLDHDNAKAHMDRYFMRLLEFSKQSHFSSRIRFLIEALPLRSAKEWRCRELHLLD